MRLQDFIRFTFYQIKSGVDNTNARVKHDACKIGYPTEIEFDLAVYDHEGEVHVVNYDESTPSNMSRLKITVPTPWHSWGNRDKE